MTQALGAAQTPLRWEGKAAQPTPVSRSGFIDRSSAKSALPLGSNFNVAQFEAMAQQLVATQRVPGLAMAIVHNGRVLSARGYGVTDTRAPLQSAANVAPTAPSKGCTASKGASFSVIARRVSTTR